MPLSPLKFAPLSLGQRRHRFQERKNGLTKLIGIVARLVRPVLKHSASTFQSNLSSMSCFLCSGTPTFCCSVCDETFCHLCEFDIALDGRLCVKCGISDARNRIDDLEEQIEDIECDLDTIKDDDTIEEKREEQSDLRGQIDELEAAKDEAEGRIEMIRSELEAKIADATTKLKRLGSA